MAPAATSTWGVIPDNQIRVTQDAHETFTTPKNQYFCNFLKTNTFNTNYMDLDAEISLVMGRVLQRLRKMISSMPGSVQSMPKVSLPAIGS